MNNNIETNSSDSFELGDNFVVSQLNVVYGRELDEFECLGGGNGAREILSETWELSYCGNVIASKTTSESCVLNGRDAVSLIEFFKPEIMEVYDGNEKRFVWLKRLKNPLPEDVPPWEGRVSCVRLFNYDRYSFNDNGNAYRFADECKGWLVYDRGSDKWYAWVNNHWELACGKEMAAARFVAESLKGEEGMWRTLLGEGVVKGFTGHVVRSGNAAQLKNMLSVAASSLSVDLFDVSKPEFLACKNCVIDTRSGRVFMPWEYDEVRGEYPLVYVDCEYHENASAEEWMRELELLMTDDALPEGEGAVRAQVMSEYLMRILGYGLFAGNPSRKFVFFYGSGMNGKTIISEVLADIFGDEFGKAAFSQMASSSCDHASPSIADALPRRFMVFSEADGESGKVSTSMLKDISSGEEYTTRFRRMFANNKKVRINCLPIAVTNSLPEFDSAIDKAELDRIVAVRFCHVFTEEDTGVKSRLLGERDAIFSMLVQNLLVFLREGLPAFPKELCGVQEEFLAGADLFQFFRQCYEKVDDGKCFVSRRELGMRYMTFCDLIGIEYSAMRVVGADGCVTGRRLSNKDAEKLYAAARVLGFQEKRTNTRGRGFSHIRERCVSEVV